MTDRLIKFLPASAIIFFAMMLFPQSVFALGISPGTVSATNVINGIKIERKITVTRANPSHDETLSVVVNGEAAHYITLSNATLLLPKGVQQVPYTFYITPIAAPNGTHNATIVFTELQSKAAGSANNLTTLLSITGHVQFDVTDKQVRDFTIGSIDPTDSEIDQPMVLTFAVTNNGNVDARPDSIDVSVADTTDPKHIITGHVDGADILAVPPLTTQTVVVKFTPNPGPTVGEYVGSILITDAQKEIASNKNAKFKVYPPGTLSQSVAFNSFISNATKLEPGSQMRFDANIANTGSGNASVLFNVDIYSRGKIIDTLRTEKQIMVRGANGHLSLAYSPKDSGSYEAHAWIEYGISRTEEKVLQYSVNPSKLTIIIFATGSVVLLCICIGIVWMLTKHKFDKKNKKHHYGKK
ncbi:MAG: hypothetical protein NT003_05215 [Candidatus Magasanikbacteria bacterium]|nr:hypothetical protein [Candidatus Magasanikbacteria bacterium]